MVPRWLKMGLKLLATGTSTMLLAACYGVVQAMYGPPAGYREGRIQVVGNDGESLPGIKVSFQESDSQNPDPNAWFAAGVTEADGTHDYAFAVDAAYLHVKLSDIDNDTSVVYEEKTAIVDEDPEIVTLEIEP